MGIRRIPDFDNISFAYDFLKALVFGQSIEKAQVSFLLEIPSNSSVLIIGGGTGKLLEEVCRTGKPGSITYLELSGKMLAAAKKRMASKKYGIGSNIRFIHGNLEALSPMEKYDVIFTPFVLDVLEEKELAIFMGAIDKILHSEGFWFFSDFQVTTSNPIIRYCQNALTKLMFVFFYFVSDLNSRKLPDFDAYFLKLGYSALYSASFCNDFIHSKVWVRNHMR